MTDTAPTTTAPAPALPEEEPSIGTLIADASRDISTLIQHEITLAKSELKVSATAGGIGIALFGAAAFIIVLAIIMISVALAYFISMTGLHLAWCFTIVFVLYVLLAALLGYIGYQKVRKVRPPDRALHQAQETKKALLNRA
jgi:hypothetical protein